MLLTFLIACALGAIHVFAGYLRFASRRPRSRWLSFAGGCSVAYVFVHLLPELASGQEAISRAVPDGMRFAERHVYVIALAALTAFYGIERAAVLSRRANREAGGPDQTQLGVFWMHISVFAIYTALIGYLLLHREQPGLVSLALFAFAMGLHFLVNDTGLREHHKSAYEHIGRWLIAVAVLAGWGVGTAVEVSKAAVAVLFGALSGAAILNIMKEELPEERESRFSAFALGAAFYAAIVIWI